MHIPPIMLPMKHAYNAACDATYPLLRHYYTNFIIKAGNSPTTCGESRIISFISTLKLLTVTGRLPDPITKLI